MKNITIEERKALCQAEINSMRAARAESISIRNGAEEQCKKFTDALHTLTLEYNELRLLADIKDGKVMVVNAETFMPVNITYQ